jgi:hypothetical protein
VKVKHPIGVLNIDGRTLLKWIINNKVIEMWAGLINLGVRTSEVFI